MYLADQWTEYELIDTDGGRRLERWKDYLLIRPDPQVIWKGVSDSPLWGKADGSYFRSERGGGSWSRDSKLPQEWRISYRPLGLTFRIRPMGFKHTGLFPEQAVNWDWFSGLIRDAGRPVRLLNLFAYTGGATLAAARAGASVTHVDAAKGMVAQARENAALSGLSDAPVRWIVDDCRKFVEREIRRGSRYDAVILDPPSYGRGPAGEVWKLEESIHPFLEMCTRLLSDDPLFVLLNSYTAGLSPAAMGYLLGLTMKGFGGRVESDEVGLPVSQTGLILPCGAAARWVREGGRGVAPNPTKETF